MTGATFITFLAGKCQAAACASVQQRVKDTLQQRNPLFAMAMQSLPGKSCSHIVHSLGEVAITCGCNKCQSNLHGGASLSELVHRPTAAVTPGHDLTCQDCLFCSSTYLRCVLLPDRSC